MRAKDEEKKIRETQNLPPVVRGKRKSKKPADQIKQPLPPKLKTGKIKLADDKYRLYDDAYKRLFNEARKHYRREPAEKTAQRVQKDIAVAMRKVSAFARRGRAAKGLSKAALENIEYGKSNEEKRREQIKKNAKKV